MRLPPSCYVRTFSPSKHSERTRRSCPLSTFPSQPKSTISIFDTNLADFVKLCKKSIQISSSTTSVILTWQQSELVSYKNHYQHSMRTINLKGRGKNGSFKLCHIIRVAVLKITFLNMYYLLGISVTSRPQQHFNSNTHQLSSFHTLPRFTIPLQICRTNRTTMPLI